MELLERYLQAVKFWLPNEQKQDIIAELSEDLRSQIEDRETELGRNLNEAEIEAILKERGRPLLVANRYQPQQYLIGPVLFPIYRFVLKIVALCYLLPWVIVWLCLLAFSPSYRVSHGNWAMSAMAGWSSLWVLAVSAFGIVTLVFTVLEHAQAKSRFLENWNPRRLPPLRDPNQIKRSASIGELAGNFALIWWISYLSSPLLVNRPEIRVTLSHSWTYLFRSLLLLAICNMALAGWNLMRPYWTGVRATLRLVTDGIGWALFCWFLKANMVAELVIPSIPPARVLLIRDGANLWMAKSLPLALVFGVIILGVDTYRIIRVTRKDRFFAPGVPVTVV